MDYVLIFLAGMLAASAAIGIGFFAFASKVWKEQREVKAQRERLSSDASQLNQRANELEARRAQLNADESSFRNRKVQYDSLASENELLKQDLFNLHVQVKKTERDVAATTQRQDEIDQLAGALAQRYLDENVAWISHKLNANNFVTCKKRLTKTIERCRGIGFEITADEEERHVQDLKKNFEDAVRLEFQRQEQARIKAQIREEEKLAREIEKQLKDAEREREAIKAALEKALRRAEDEHSVEVEQLRAKLKEAEERAERAKSQAQLTKSGHVYVLSNIGSFGEGVFKVGMTRRLEPSDRVRELGDASVPFPFDVHMMISCDNAPALENQLHRELHRHRVNRVNLRKEYFKVDFDQIVNLVQSNFGEVDYVAHPEADQFRQSLEMTDEDQEFVEGVFDSLTADEDEFVSED